MKYLTALLGALAAGAALAEWPLDGTRAFDVANVAFTLAALFALLTLVRAARTCRPSERRIWRSLAVAAGAWLLGQCAWDVITLFDANPAAPTIADLLWIAFAVAAAVGVYRFAPVPPRVRRVLDVDAVALAASAGALTIAYEWSSLQSSALPLAGRVTAIAYPVSYTMVVALGLGALIGTPEVLRRRDLMLVFAGIVVEGIAFALWCPQVLDGTYQQGSSMLDALWVAGLLLLGTGGLTAHRTAASVEPSIDRLRRRTLLPALGFASLVITLVVVATQGAPLTPRLTLMGAIAAVGVLLLARNWLAFAAVEGLERERALALVRRNRELEAFAYSASHDLKAPLVSIEGFASLLERELGERLDERSSHYVARIHANALSMQQMIDDLFAFARSGGDDDAGAVAVDTNQLARELADEWSERAEAAGMPLQLDAGLPTVRAHPVRLKQALTNLIDNAIRYGDGHVRLSGNAHEGFAQLVVEDGGAGIPVGEREQIFEFFSRGAVARETVPEGTGLGLALVRRIVEANGGDVRYEHAATSRFVLTFPGGPS